MDEMDKDVSLNLNDIKILKAIFDPKTKRGFVKSYGTSVKEIQDETSFSLSKIRSTLQKFKKMGWITEGVKDERCKSYCITEKGYDGLSNLTDMTVDL